MTTPALRASRAVWRAREKFRYNKWFTYRHQKGTAAVHAARSKWWVLYSEAHTKRAAIDRELAERKKKEHATEVSNYGTNFIAHFEGYVGHVYNDGTGVQTVGYGHIENVPGNGIWVKGQRSRYHLTEAEAKELLHQDLNKHYAPTIRSLNLGLDQNEFDALTSFVYNVGVGGVSPGTHVGQYLRQHNFRAAANALLEWSRAGGKVLQGLLNRREAERRLFLT